MSVRGPSRGRGRGRGRGRTMIWEWETYTPSPSVYDNIWHVRQAPVAVTPHVPNDCPIPDARTRILERRQTEDGFGRNFYFVEITYLGGQEPTSTWVQSSDNSDRTGTEVERVDVSRILQYVSPRELERFENEQFRVEAEAQAVADKEAEEEQIRRRMLKNARMAGSGRGRGSKMLDGLGIDPELRGTSVSRSRSRGRGRGRGRGRSSWCGRGEIGASRRSELEQDKIVDSEPSQPYSQHLPASRDEIAETSTESEDELAEPVSPGLMRSAFVTNSALPLSPVHLRRPAPPKPLRHSHPEVPDIADTDTTSSSDRRTSMSSAAMQLKFEGDFGDIAIAESEPAESDSGSEHRAKRRRTESMTPRHTLMFPSSSQIEDSDSGDSIPPDLPSTAKAHKHHNASPNAHSTHRAAPSSSHNTVSMIDGAVDSSEDEDKDEVEAEDTEDAEEYVIEAILKHHHDEHGRKFYLVKWEGYEDSHDWLPEEELAGAAELVSEYNEKWRRQKGKGQA